jgi:pimeloyl-ACP methyl ester carboxylesterase
MIPRRIGGAVRVPVLLIYGANDERVPPGSAAAIRAANGGNAPVETLLIADADHSYMLRAATDVCRIWRRNSRKPWWRS